MKVCSGSYPGVRSESHLHRTILLHNHLAVMSSVVRATGASCFSLEWHIIAVAGLCYRVDLPASLLPIDS